MRKEIIIGLVVIISFLVNIIGFLAIFTYYIPNKEGASVISEDVNQLPIVWILFIGGLIFFYISLVWLFMPDKFLKEIL